MDFAYFDLNPTLWRTHGKTEEELNGRNVGHVFGMDNMVEHLPVLNM